MRLPLKTVRERENSPVTGLKTLKVVEPLSIQKKKDIQAKNSLCTGIHHNRARRKKGGSGKKCRGGFTELNLA